MFVQKSKKKKEKKEKREKKGAKEKKEKARKEKQSQYIETEGVTTPSKEELPASLAATPAVYKLPVSLGLKKLLFATQDIIVLSLELFLLLSVFAHYANASYSFR